MVSFARRLVPPISSRHLEIVELEEGRHERPRPLTRSAISDWFARASSMSRSAMAACSGNGNRSRSSKRRMMSLCSSSCACELCQNRTMPAC